MATLEVQDAREQRMRQQLLARMEAVSRKLDNILGTKEATLTVDAHRVFDERSGHLEVNNSHMLRVTVSHVLYPVTEEVLHQVFDAFGAEKVYVHGMVAGVEALILFRSCRDAVRAREALHDRCIYDNCCWLNIQYYQDDKSGYSTSFIRKQVGQSTFGNMDDSLRTASQILSNTKPPSEIRFSQSIPATQECSLASSESKTMLDMSHEKKASNRSVVDNSSRTVSGSMTSGLSHFVTQHHVSVQSCLKAETVWAKSSVSTHRQNESSGNDHQTIRRQAGFEGLELDMVHNPAFDMSNAKEIDSSSKHHSGNSNGYVPVLNVATIPGLREDKCRHAGQRSTDDRAVDEKCVSGPFFAPSNLTRRDSDIQRLIDVCPSLDGSPPKLNSWPPLNFGLRPPLNFGLRPPPMSLFHLAFPCAVNAVSFVCNNSKNTGKVC